MFAQFPMPTQRPQEDTQPAQLRELVSRYCRLDYEGGRLDPKMWPRFQPLVWWTAAQPFTKINVIARYTVDPEPSGDHNKFAVTVHYRLLGTFDPALGYVKEPEGHDPGCVLQRDLAEHGVAHQRLRQPAAASLACGHVEVADRADQHHAGRDY